MQISEKDNIHIDYFKFEYQFQYFLKPFDRTVLVP